MKQPSAVETFAAFRAKHKPLAETIALNKKAEAELKAVTQGIYKTGAERQKVESFLKSINFDEYDTADVLENCSTDPDARAYWVGRASKEVI